MIKNRIVLIVCLLMFVVSCKDDVLPKPKAQLRLEYPEATYSVFKNDCPYYFQINTSSTIEITSDCSATIDYKHMKGTIFITYKSINGNLKQLLIDAQKFNREHTVKASAITDQPFMNPEAKAYGMLYEVSGNAASQAQFYLTDSINHFVTGSLYFYSKPNYDSILPAADYLKKDIRRIMESFEWN